MNPPEKCTLASTETAGTYYCSRFSNHDGPCAAHIANTKPPFSIGSTVWPGVAKFGEECSEAATIVFKLIERGGDPNYWGDVDLRDRLIEEMGDVFATILYVLDNSDMGNSVRHRASVKLELFNQWHREAQQRPLPPPPDTPLVDLI